MTIKKVTTTVVQCDGCSRDMSEDEERLEVDYMTHKPWGGLDNNVNVFCTGCAAGRLEKLHEDLRLRGPRVKLKENELLTLRRKNVAR